MKNFPISVIIPVFNEEKFISACLASLNEQTCPILEVIVINDGSIDSTAHVLKIASNKIWNFTLICVSQKHSGSGIARNLGARRAKGNILVFVDADMTFDEDFIRELIKPIKENKSIGTFSQDEILANPENYWARCWNMGRFSSAGVYTKEFLKTMIPNPKNKGGIYRAVLKIKFNEVNGFETSGDYTDDESLVKKLGVRATLVKGAVFYHKNPSNIFEVWERAKWIGSGRNFTDGTRKKLSNIVKFSLPMSFFKGVLISLRFGYPLFLPFKLVYDMAIWFSVIQSI